MKKLGVQDSVPLPVNFVEVVYVEKGVGQHHVHIYSHNVVTSDLSKAERLYPLLIILHNIEYKYVQPSQAIGLNMS